MSRSFPISRRLSRHHAKTRARSGTFQSSPPLCDLDHRSQIRLDRTMFFSFKCTQALNQGNVTTRSTGETLVVSCFGTLAFEILKSPNETIQTSTRQSRSTASTRRATHPPSQCSEYYLLPPQNETSEIRCTQSRIPRFPSRLKSAMCVFIRNAGHRSSKGYNLTGS